MASSGTCRPLVNRKKVVERERNPAINGYRMLHRLLHAAAATFCKPLQNNGLRRNEMQHDLPVVGAVVVANYLAKTTA